MDTKTVKTMEFADEFIFHTYARFPITLIKGDGCKVWDEDGKEYLDFVSGIAVCALGHSSPIVAKALEDQARRLVHVSNLYYTRPQAELARLLVENSFADKVFFCNSGAEANEAAIKLARRYSNEKTGSVKNVIVSMEQSFHGRTMATMSATGQGKIKKGYDPLLTGFKFVPFNDLERLENAVDENVCGVMLEPIQGEGGVVIPGPGYLKGVWEICKAKDLVLIFDEVQVGMGRTGRLFAYEHYGVAPHIMTLAKALGNGLPIGAMLSTEELSSAFGPGSHASTFGGTPLVTAVAESVVNSIINDHVLDNCRDMGEYFMGRLSSLKDKYDFIKNIRGLGLLIGMEMDREGADIVQTCMERGFLINCIQDRILRFIPPLIIGRQDIDSLIDVLDEIFQGIK